MIRRQAGLRRVWRSIPRESGDDPNYSLASFTAKGVFPARAGMIPGRIKPMEQQIGIPRESGDDPFETSRHDVLGEYSPRERG